MIRTLACFMGCVASFQAADAVARCDAVTVERFTLDNGVAVIAVHDADAQRQTTLTFLPRSLATDPPGRAQWAHLLEHMLIRSTDPLDLAPQGMQINGETGPEYLRLDSYAEPGHWEESIERHAAWLAARDFDADTLEREKLNIAREEQATAQSGFTHKWAIAAWNQAVRYRKPHAAVHGDVEHATIDAVEAAAREMLVVDDGVLIATIGPAPLEQLKASIIEHVGAIPVKSIEERGSGRVEHDLGGEFEATWDLPTSHLLLWWPVPHETLGGRAAGRAFGNALMARFYQGEGVGGDSRALVHDLIRTPEGVFLIVNVRLGRDVEPEAVRDAVLREVEALTNAPAAVAAVGAMAARTVALPDDFAPLRERYGGAARSEFLEANVLLQAAIAEFVIDAPYDDIAAALSDLDDDALERILVALSAPPHGRLLLTPADDGDE